MRPETVDTAAATAGSSSQIRSRKSNPMAATIENYDDDKDEQNINPLPKDSKELLLLEESKTRKDMSRVKAHQRAQRTTG